MTTSKTYTATANLQILDEMNCDPDKLNNFEDFAETLGLWASQYIPEIQLPIARNAEELFEVASVRILLCKWHDAYKANRQWQRDCFKDIAVDGSGCVTPDSFNSYYKSEQNAYNTALHALIIA